MQSERMSAWRGREGVRSLNFKGRALCCIRSRTSTAPATFTDACCTILTAVDMVIIVGFPEE